GRTPMPNPTSDSLLAAGGPDTPEVSGCRRHERRQGSPGIPLSHCPIRGLLSLRDPDACRVRATREIFERGLEFPSLESIALVDVAGFKAASKPADALLGRAVGERIGDDVALGLLLEAVVADGGGGAKGAFQVALLEDVPHFLGVVRPDAGVEVGLELDAHRQF